MSIVMEVETLELQTFKKKASGESYQMQEGYVHTIDRNTGRPGRYPERTLFFPPRRDGVVSALAPGKYVLSPASFRVVNGRLELGFPVWVPMQAQGK